MQDTFFDYQKCYETYNWGNPDLILDAINVYYFMQTVLNSGISELSLHDSSIVAIVRSEDCLELTFDWAKIDSSKELNIKEPLILGQTKLALNGISSEEFKVFENNGNSIYRLAQRPDFLSKEREPIANTSVDIDAMTITIAQLIKENGNYFWSEWSIKFASYQMSWNSFVTFSDWENGKLPNDSL